MYKKPLNNKLPLIRNSYKFVIRYIDLILFGNIYVALGAVCLTQSTVIQLGYPNHLLSYSVLVFFSTLFIYNLQRIFYTPMVDNNLNSIRRKWIFENQNAIKTLCFIGGLGICIAGFYVGLNALIYLSPLLLLSLSYFIPFIKLRENAWLKLLTLVTVWTITTAVIPILLTNFEGITKNELLHILVRFCFMIAICIPFDIRDLKIDEADTISTLPRLLGEKNTHWLANLFIIIYGTLIIVEFKWGIVGMEKFIALIVSAVISGAIVIMSNSKRSEYFFVAGVDGTMILQGILLFIASL